MDATYLLMDEPIGCAVVMNLCVRCKNSTSFIKFIEDFALAHRVEYIFKQVEECIKVIGEHQVVQVVTHNVTFNMAHEEQDVVIMTYFILEQLCPYHHLMLQDIGKLPKYVTVIDKARSPIFFLYVHHSTFAMMQKCTNRREFVRPGVTRFSCHFSRVELPL